MSNDYVEDAMRYQTEIERLTGESPRAFGNITTALEQNNETKFEKFDERVNNHLTECVNEAIEAGFEDDNAPTNANVTKQMDSLKVKVGPL